MKRLNKKEVLEMIKKYHDDVYSAHYDLIVSDDGESVHEYRRDRGQKVNPHVLMFASGELDEILFSDVSYKILHKLDKKYTNTSSLALITELINILTIPHRYDSLLDAMAEEPLEASIVMSLM